MSLGRLALVSLAALVLISGCGRGGVTEAQVRALLTVAEVENVILPWVPLKAVLTNYNKTGEAEHPWQVESAKSFYGLSFQIEDGRKSIILSVVDFNSQARAQEHFEKVRSATEGAPPLVSLASLIGDASAGGQLNTRGIGSVVVFLKGDVVISLYATQPQLEPPLALLEDLEKLAELVAKRL